MNQNQIKQLNSVVGCTFAYMLKVPGLTPEEDKYPFGVGSGRALTIKKKKSTAKSNMQSCCGDAMWIQKQLKVLSLGGVPTQKQIKWKSPYSHESFYFRLMFVEAQTSVQLGLWLLVSQC